METGVYLDDNRHTAIVVQVKNGAVAYLTLFTGAVEVHRASLPRFKREFHIALPNYPIRTAIRKYAKSGLPLTEDAKTVMRLVLANTATTQAA